MESVLGKIFQIGKGYEMIVSRKRLGRSLKLSSKEVMMRTCPLLVRQIREKERLPARRVTLMEVHHN